MIKKLKIESEFSRNALTLMTGTTIAQVVSIAISPILTRIYTPEDFGIYAFYMSIVMIFTNLVAGRYEQSILLPKNNNNAKHIVVFSIILSFCCSVVIFIVISSWNIIYNNEMQYWIFLIPINIFILSIISILYIWHNRNKKYNILSKHQILKSSVQGTINLLIGISYKIQSGLIFGTLIGGLASMIYLLKTIKNDFLKFNFFKLRAIVLMKKYKNFPKFMLPSTILESISIELPILLISSFFGSSIVGYYALSQRIVKIPLILISSSIANVFRQEASILFAKSSNCRVLYQSTFKKLVIIGTVPFILFLQFYLHLFLEMTGIKQENIVKY